MSKKLTNPISPLLSNLLKDYSLTVSDLAKSINVPASTLYRNLQRKTPMSLETALKIQSHFIMSDAASLQLLNELNGEIDYEN
jgi:predicted transcriptional regulator